MKMGREKMNKRMFKQMRCILVLLVCVICAFSPASAEEGLVGLWRYEYNDNITLFNLMADNTYEMVITSYPHISKFTGKYSVAGSEIVMTENVSGDERADDFTTIYKIYGDMAMFGSYKYFRVAKEDAAGLLETPFARYDRTITLSQREALELAFDSSYRNDNDVVVIELYFENEHYSYFFRPKWPDGDQAPEGRENYHLGLEGFSFKNEFYIFRLYEFIQDDEESGHTVTMGYYAVNRNNGEIVYEYYLEDLEEQVEKFQR